MHGWLLVPAIVNLTLTDAIVSFAISRRLQPPR